MFMISTEPTFLSAVGDMTVRVIYGGQVGDEA